jgi:selenocysteine lyase/cysteine desulfurase
VGFDADGLIDLAALESLLRSYNEQRQHGAQRIKLVAVSGASNVLGTCNDLAAISQLVHRHGAHLLVDAAQLVAHRKVDMAAWDIDYLVFSGHKVYAPFGTGVLVARKGLLAYTPAQLADVRASGEENVGGIAALARSLLLLDRIGLDVVEAEERALTARALRGLAQVPGLTVYGTSDPESPHFMRKGGVIAFNLGENLSGTVGAALAEQAGIGIRCGCHCAHLTVKRMLHIHPMLERFQRVIVTLFPKLSLPGVARVSLGIENTPADVDALLATLGKLAQQKKIVSGKADGKQALDGFAEAVSARVYATLA